MPRSKISVGAVRNPTNLAKLMNDQQLQISNIRLLIDELIKGLRVKAANKKVQKKVKETKNDPFS